MSYAIVHFSSGESVVTSPFLTIGTQDGALYYMLPADGEAAVAEGKAAFDGEKRIIAEDGAWTKAELFEDDGVLHGVIEAGSNGPVFVPASNVKA